MSWSTPATAVTGDVIPASFWNTNGRDNLNYLKGLLSGSATDPVTLAALLTLNAGVVAAGGVGLASGANFGNTPPPASDSRVYIGWNITNGGRDGAIVVNDTGPLLIYSKPGGVLTAILSIGTDGKLTGKGFYDSGEFVVTTNSSVTLNHGLGGQPRRLLGYHGGGTPTNTMRMNALGISGEVGISSATVTQIVVVNNTALSTNARVFAQL